MTEQPESATAGAGDSPRYDPTKCSRCKVGPAAVVWTSVHPVTGATLRHGLGVCDRCRGDLTVRVIESLGGQS